MGQNKIQKFREGNIVNLQSWDDFNEINDMLNSRWVYDHIYYDKNGMFKHSGDTVTLSRVYPSELKPWKQVQSEDKPVKWSVKENRWYWHEDWFIDSKPFLLDKDFDI